MRFDDRVCSGWFAVKQGLCYGCVLVTLMFNIFFAAVINVACLHAFQGGQRHHRHLKHLRKKTGARG